MLWKIESVVENIIAGWAYDASFDGAVEILALKDASIIARTDACEPRPYLSEQGHPRTKCGFHIELPEGFGVDSVRLVCMPPSLKGECLVVFSSDKEEIGKIFPSYQKSHLAEHGGVAGGSSKSEEKLRSLYLPLLRGLDVLDLGCNEGYFCNHAATTGAKSVLGVDASELSIERAKARTKAARSVFENIDGKPLIEFQCASWWDIPERKFDIILFLSAIHYEPEQQKLLDFLSRRLKPDGVLVLECGVAPGKGHFWRSIKRSIDTRRFPSAEMLEDTLLRSYAVRFIGNSVNQAGDPLPRYVYHCTPRKSIACIIRGPSGSGKTILASQLRQKGLTGYSSDLFFKESANSDTTKTLDTSLYRKIREEIGPKQLHRVSAYLRESGCVEQFCRDFILTLPLEDDLLYIEGEVFSDDAVFEELVKQLEARGLIVWDIQRA